jgi:diacylglycerol kinase family enzyme
MPGFARRRDAAVWFHRGANSGANTAGELLAPAGCYSRPADRPRWKGTNVTQQAILVHNASAGTREPTKEELIALLEGAGYRVKYRNSKRPDLEAKLDKQGDLVIAAGGDGTIAKVAKILLGKPEQVAPLAILPLGTANNIARSLGITETPEAIVARWSHEPIRKLSHGIVHAHWGEQRFIEGVGLGSLAEATAPKSKDAKSRDQRIHQGRVAFRRSIKHAKPERLYVTVDGTRIEDEVVLIEIMNIRQVGPRLRLAPSADPGDDLLDVAYVTTEHRDSLLEWLDALIDGKLDEAVAGPPPVATIPGRKITIAWNGMDLRIDDKFPLMPGQATAPSMTKKETKKTDKGEEDEKTNRDHADLVTIEIAERQLEILAPQGEAKGDKAKRSA